MLLTWFTLGGFIFLLAPQNMTNKFQFAFARVFRWPLGIGRNVSLSARTRQSIADLVSRRKYNQLQNHLANVREELLQERQKSEKLSSLRDRYAWEGVEFVLADVITASVDKLHGELTINRGKDNGLETGQFVLGDNSIIGAIADVSGRAARVRLITDPASNIAVRITGLNLERLMQGNGGGAAKIKMVQIKHKIKTGVEIKVCKKAGFLEVPMITGTVAECKRDDENPSLWDITVKPVCDIEKLSDVAVIVMSQQE